ncbi:MAG: polysaccharide biosynthesis protein [Candidatus Sericytochromatia bacterium]
MNILLVGGTGSFGTAFLEHLEQIAYKAKVRVYSRDEAKQIGLKTRFTQLQLETVIGDVRDEYAYAQATKGMDVVIHAAALKHVPIGELFTEEALKTNTHGVINCVKACQAQGVRKAVFLSTDKAVYPINAYGMSKALGEKIMQSKISRDSDTVFTITRYGNVLGSRGSILPLLKQKLSQRETIPVTDFAMTRFLMTLEQAVSLVSYAIDKGQDGQLFIQKVPACDLRTLMEAYLRLHHGSSLDEYGYEIVGVRPGEKIHEVLATREELSRARLLQAEEILQVEPYQQQELYRGTRREIAHEPDQDLSSDSVQMLSVDEVIACLKQAGL